ncbi:unnamed protein product [Linum tenue]|uniref:Uncharacterized protein n=1 Tax=Linum tenue TaxID=586396 RepID=A0AAV0LCG0_9ROSI|nr:unnamed protein product [Linum tenue]
MAAGKSQSPTSSSAWCDGSGLRRGPWSSEEDQKLLSYIQLHGHGSWRTLPEKAGLQRCGKSCRLRWINYLRPGIKRGKFTLHEEQTIIQLHALLGNRWSAIAAHLPRRTDNEIKNHWNTHLKKRLSLMGIDPATHKPKVRRLDGGDPKNASTLSHMAQWETARLEAEARLVRESDSLRQLQLQVQLPSHSSSSTSAPPLPSHLAPPRCLDVLSARALGLGSSCLQSPISNFADDKMHYTCHSPFSSSSSSWPVEIFATTTGIKLSTNNITHHQLPGTGTHHLEQHDLQHQGTMATHHSNIYSDTWIHDHDLSINFLDSASTAWPPMD